MSPITQDPQVKKLRDLAKQQRDRRAAAAEAVRVRAAELETMDDAKKLQQAKDAAEQARKAAKDAWDKATKDMQSAEDKHDSASDELAGLKTSRSVLQTLIYTTEPSVGMAAAFGVAADDRRIKDIVAKLQAEVAKLDKTIAVKETAVKALADAQATARDKARTSEIAWHAAEEKLELAVEQEKRRIEADQQKSLWQQKEQDAETVLKKTEDDLTDLISKKTRADRFPAEVPAYLRVSVGSGPVEPAAEQVLRELRASNAAFQPHEHFKDLNEFATDYGINGQLVSILDSLNRTKDRAVKRRILADSYAYTLLALLNDIKDETTKAGGNVREEMQEALEDRTAFVNRVRDFQRDGLPKKKAGAPQQIFANALLLEVARREHATLPADPAAKQELVVRVLSTL
jgi:hypothetical protein